jgi:hypothetical protein
MRGHKRHHLPSHLQLTAADMLEDRDIAVQIDPVQTLHIEAHMPVKNIVYRHHRSHLRSVAPNMTT